MGLPRFVVQLVETTAFGSKLNKLSDSVKDWRGFWKEVFIPRYTEMVQQNFETEGELVGGWPGLEPAYDAWKARHFPGTKILERTRRLRSSLAHGVADSSDTVLQVRPLELRFGTRVPYGKWVRRDREILPPIVKKDWAPLVNAYFKAKAREAGLSGS